MALLRKVIHEMRQYILEAPLFCYMSISDVRNMDETIYTEKAALQSIDNVAELSCVVNPVTSCIDESKYSKPYKGAHILQKRPIILILVASTCMLY